MKTEDLTKFLIIFLTIALICVVFAIGIYAFYFRGEIVVDNEQWGMFGDYLGGVLNPLFGFLGFIALLLALNIQSRELEASSTALNKQAELIDSQIFNSTFFEMLKQLSSMVEDLEVETNYDETVKGRGSLKYIYTGELKNSFAPEIDYPSMEVSDDKIIAKMANAYRFFLADFEHFLFWTEFLERIFEHINENEDTHKDKTKYYKITMATLSSYQKVFLFYSAWFNEESKLKGYITENELLETLDFRLLLNNKHTKFYHEDAYGCNKDLIES